MRDLEAIDLAADELEAMRLTDLEGLYQEQAAEQMGVSRQTLGLILMASFFVTYDPNCFFAHHVTRLQQLDELSKSFERTCFFFFFLNTLLVSIFGYALQCS